MKTIEEIVEDYSKKNFTGDLKLQRENDLVVLHFESGLLLSTKLNGAFDDGNYFAILDWKADSFKISNENIEGKKEENMTELDTSKAIKIAKDTYWVGYRNPDTMLQINVFLRIFKGNGKQINMLIDPGSPIDFDPITEKVESIIGIIFTKIYF